jgi:hypothetical protein
MYSIKFVQNLNTLNVCLLYLCFINLESKSREGCNERTVSVGMVMVVAIGNGCH